MKCIDRPSWQAVVIAKKVRENFFVGVAPISQQSDDTRNVFVDGHTAAGFREAGVVEPVEKAGRDLSLFITVNRNKLTFIDKIFDSTDGLVEIVSCLRDGENMFAGG